MHLHTHTVILHTYVHRRNLYACKHAPTNFFLHTCTIFFAWFCMHQGLWHALVHLVHVTDFVCTHAPQGFGVILHALDFSCMHLAGDLVCTHAPGDFCFPCVCTRGYCTHKCTKGWGHPSFPRRGSACTCAPGGWTNTCALADRDIPTSQPGDFAFACAPGRFAHTKILHRHVHQGLGMS